MGIGIHGPDGADSRGSNIAAAASAAAATSSLEATLDEATDRYTLAPEVQRELFQLKAGLGGAAAMTVSAPRPDALARVPQRLRWRGREVSDEFQRYAERVASGEELAPYRGQVLARPCVDSPWGVPEPAMPGPVRRSVAVGALLAASAWIVAVLLIAPRPVTSNAALQPLPDTARYAAPEASSHLGALSLADLEPLGDVQLGDALSRHDRARALTRDSSSKGATRAVSARRRGAGASSAASSVPSSASAPARAAKPEDSAAREAPAAPSAETDEFDWLLDGADEPAAAAAAAPVDPFDWLLDGADEPAVAPLDERTVTAPPPVAPESTTRAAAPARRPAPSVADAPSPDTGLLLERAPF
jgi:hypothetical protein